MAKIKLEIISPNKVVYSADIDMFLHYNLLNHVH